MLFLAFGQKNVFQPNLILILLRKNMYLCMETNKRDE